MLTSPNTISPPGTIFCLFCRGVVSLKDEKLEKFKKHMQDVHEIYFEHEFILAGSFLKEEEKENIIAAARVRIKKSKTESKIAQDQLSRSSFGENIEKPSTNISDNFSRNAVEERKSIGHFESIKPLPSEVVTVKAIHYGEFDEDEEDLTRHGFKIQEFMQSSTDVNISVKEKSFSKEETTTAAKATKLHKCENCNKQFMNSRKLKNHKMNFRNKNCIKSKASCDSCSKTFKSRQSLNIHKFNEQCGGA